MAYFSASDAWSMQFIGLWPEEKQNQVADWLFSTENDANGQPKGIGLSLWRFNVGSHSSTTRVRCSSGASAYRRKRQLSVVVKPQAEEHPHQEQATRTTQFSETGKGTGSQ